MQVNIEQSTAHSVLVTCWVNNHHNKKRYPHREEQLENIERLIFITAEQERGNNVRV